MRLGLKVSLLFLLLSWCFMGKAQARVDGYTYPYDISQIEWQLLNWTSAWRGTITPADPFTLDRMEYDRNTKKVLIYLTGKTDTATDENLKKSIDGIVSLFQKRFPNFNLDSDAYVYYKLTSDKDQNVSYKEYKNGTFTDQQSPPEPQKSREPAMMPPATSY
jgi:hypothetical protein